MFLIIIQGVLLQVAILTVAERKFMGATQKRIGPNQVGYRGILQPIADGIKQLLKENVVPIESNNFIFLGAPLILFYLSLMNWLVIPLDTGVAIYRIQYGILYLIALGEQGVYGVIFSGWASNSKYPLIGSLRSTAQMISYSVALSLIILTVVLCVGSQDLLKIFDDSKALMLAIPQWPIVILFFLSLLAETNRAPFDLPEAESELVAGFMTEYSAVGFVYFFLGENVNLITMSTQLVLFFFGGLNIILTSILISGVLLLIILVRSTLPRVRLDGLFRLGWINLLPLTIGIIILILSIKFIFFVI